MKKFIEFLKQSVFAGSILCIVLSSCSDMNDLHKEYLEGEVIYAAIVDSAVLHPGKYRAILDLTINSQRIDTIHIYWNDYANSTHIVINGRVGKFPVEIDNLEERDYIFYIVSIDKFGNRSLPFETSGRVYGDKMQNGLIPRSILSIYSMDIGTTVTYGSVPENSLYTDFAYTDSEGNSQIVQISNSETSTSIAGWPSIDSLRTVFLPANAVDTIYSKWTTVSTQITESTPFKGPYIFSAAAPCIIEARNFDFGGEGVAFHDNNTNNEPGSGYRADNGDPAGAAADVEGGGNIGYTNAGEWVIYTVEVQDAGVYLADMRLSVENIGDKGFSISVDGVKSEAILVPSNGSWSDWRWVFESGLYSEEIMAKQPRFNLSAGKHKVRISYETGGFNWMNFKFTREGSVTVSSNEIRLAPGDRQTLTANVVGGGNIAWSSSDPSVATVDASTGEVTAIDYGTADIIATTAAGATGKCVVIVEGFPAPVGVWTFEDADNPVKATTGTDLEATGSFVSIDGPNGAKAVKPDNGSFFTIHHDIGANGGGGRVNEYTLMMDIRGSASEFSNWLSVFNNKDGNSGDGALWIDSDGKIGYAALGGYSGTRLTPDTWHRVVIAVNFAKGSYKIYIDGALVFTATGNVSVDGDFSLSDVVYIGYDGSGYAGPSFAEVRMWGVQLTDGQVSALGGPN